MKTLYILLLILVSGSVYAEPVLHWRFANPVVVMSGSDCVLNFDVEVCANQSATYHSGLFLYIDYNSLAFGEDIVFNNRVTYTRGNLIDFQPPPGWDYAYNVNGPIDGSGDWFCFFVEHVFLANLETMPLYPEFGVLFHISITIQDPTHLAGIKFRPDSGPPDFIGLMNGNQFYVDATHPAGSPYGSPPIYAGLYDNDLLNQNLVCSTSLTLNVNSILEGTFNSGGMNSHLNQLGLIPFQQPYNADPWNYTGTESIIGLPGSNVVDWVLLELRDAPSASLANSSTVIARKACFMRNDGYIVETDGLSDPEFQVAVLHNLFVVLWHRNHLGVMSANPVDISGGSGSYDFTASGSSAYGGSIAQKEVQPGIWAMISGDGNADGNINSTDKINVWKPNIGIQAYNPGDFNMDGNVNNQDKLNCWKPNGGRSCQVP